MVRLLAQLELVSIFNSDIDKEQVSLFIIFFGICKRNILRAMNLCASEKLFGID